jgi:acyl-CoA thioester hydrolase
MQKIQTASTINIRVPYADTDQMGMVYYANYYVYFERGRTEWLRDKGLEYRSLEAKGIYLPVVESSCRYRSPARYDDLITVRTEVSDVGACSIEFFYIVTLGKNKIAEGKTKHPFVNSSMKPVRIPSEIQKLLEPE